MYKNNGTVQNEETAASVAWMAPSVVPLTNLNSGFRTYEIDSASFEIYEAKVSSTPSLSSRLLLRESAVELN